MKKILAAIAVSLGLSACVAAPPASSVPTPPVRMTVSDPISGIAQIALDDAGQAVSDLVAAGANLSTAPMSLQDSYSCAVWLHDTGIPQATQVASGLVPSLHPKGAYSLFIEGKIAYIKGKGAISSAQSTFIDTFNHYCGAALAGDVNAINVLLLKAGISVGSGGLLGGVTGILTPTL